MPVQISMTCHVGMGCGNERSPIITMRTHRVPVTDVGASLLLTIMFEYDEQTLV